MKEQVKSVIVARPAHLFPGPLGDDLAAARDFAQAEKADATRRACRSDVRLFAEYCRPHRTAPMPANPITGETSIGTWKRQSPDISDGASTIPVSLPSPSSGTCLPENRSSKPGAALRHWNGNATRGRLLRCVIQHSWNVYSGARCYGRPRAAFTPAMIAAKSAGVS